MHGLKNCSTYTSRSIIQPKKNEIMLIAGKGIELEISTLSQVSQAQKDKGHNLFLPTLKLDL
jgi:hypothetical protein